MILIKYDNDTDSFISNNWNSSSYDVACEMALDSLNNIYLAGVSGNFNKTVFTLVKFDNNLNYRWNTTFGPYVDNRCYCIAIDSQDNIYLGGNIQKEDGDLEICLVKYNSSGILQWYKLWSNFTHNYCFALTIDSSDNVYLTGRTRDLHFTRDDLCLLKYNSSGNLLWSRLHDAPTYEIGLGIAIDSQDDVFIVGQTNSDEPSTGIETFLIKYSKDGVFEWREIFKGDFYCYSTDLAIDSKDNIYLAGETILSTSNGPSISVIKYDNNGSLQWHRDWGEPHIEDCSAIAIDSMNNIFIAGDISAYEYHVEGMFIVKNPQTITNSVIIDAYPVYLILMFIIMEILSIIYTISKKIQPSNKKKF
jgi:hypothetical protein